MREIEVKAKLNQPDSVLQAAAKLGISFGEPVRQEDTTYVQHHDYSKPDWNIFRLRSTQGRTLLTMKFKASDRTHDNHEYETVVSDRQQAENMLLRLGYNRDVAINKNRRIAKYQDYEICLDEVDGLGKFIEIEKLAEDTVDVDAIQTELWKLLEQLGVSKADEVTRSYNVLVRDNLVKH